LSSNHDTISTRLSLILTKLNSGEKFNIQELAQEFNVSIRTIQRDLNERFSYLPLKKENGYYFLEEYCLGKLNFKDIKNFAILSGIKNLYPNLDNNFIVDLLNSKINQTYLIKGCKYENLSSKTLTFELLNIAIITYQTITLTYNNKVRELNPYKLINTDGIWYLSADENNQLKTYTISKISNLNTTSKTFKSNKEFENLIAQN
jgi:predicted DNA-binding transcriptional regulator YafY